jgi:hypothetical protein
MRESQSFRHPPNRNNFPSILTRERLIRAEFIHVRTDHTFAAVGEKIRIQRNDVWSE